MASAGTIRSASSLPPDTTLEYDVCVVGSGSGGGVLSHELAARGLRVLLLEEGGHHTRREFDLTEGTAYPMLYQELGNRATDDLSISILQGRSVGGGTTVNWCSSFRTPQRILDRWRDEYGVQGLTTETLSPHWDALEKRLHIAPWPLERANRNNRLLWDGLGKLGYQRGSIPRNVNNCVNLGYCGLGCPVDAKQSMLVTYIPDGVEQGLDVLANASVRQVEYDGARATALKVEIFDPEKDNPTGRYFTVKARVFALCCGAINSPSLLLRSGLDGGGLVGKRTFLHPVILSAAVFDEPVNAFYGAPQSVYSHHFNDRGPGKIGFFLEVPPIHPMLAATTLSGFGQSHGKLMASLPHVQACLAITIDGLLEKDEPCGTVGLRSGHQRLAFNYQLTEANWEAFRFAQREMARLQFAAGARQVMTLHTEPVVMNSEQDLGLIDQAPWEKLRVKVVTAHQMGGNPMGSDPARSVVDSQLRYRGLDNLFVVDGSVLPTALGVNPQETIFGLARWGAQHVAAAV